MASIVSDADDYVHEVVAALKKAGVRAEADVRNEKINYKVREHSVGKVPVILAIGMQEVEGRTVSVRRLGENRTEQFLGSGCRHVRFEALPAFGQLNPTHWEANEMPRFDRGIFVWCCAAGVHETVGAAAVL